MSTVHDHAVLDPARRSVLEHRARRLAGASVGYNAVEGVVAVTAGLVAGSAALLGFGLDSAVEVSSGLVVLWQFRRAVPASRERQAQRLIAASFFALAAFVGVDASTALLRGEQASVSPVGIGLAVASLLVMPWLARAQRRTGRELHSASVVADGGQTRLCAWMSAVLLAGLLLDAVLGWSWADPVAALVIAAVALREGRQTWRGHGCC